MWQKIEVAYNDPPLDAVDMDPESFLNSFLGI